MKSWAIISVLLDDRWLASWSVIKYKNSRAAIVIKHSVCTFVGGKKESDSRPRLSPEEENEDETHMSRRKVKKCHVRNDLVSRVCCSATWLAAELSSFAAVSCPWRASETQDYYHSFTLSLLHTCVVSLSV